MRLRLGTRASALARWQAEWVHGQLVARGHEVELVPITTQGDTSQQEAIAAMGSPGVFTKELQRALLDERIDLAVHSLKDLPTDVVPGLALAAVPEREATEDALISRGGERLEELPQQASVGTGSLRRRAQLLHLRPDLQLRDIRGNVDTRLQKLERGDYDAIVLARAGLRRLGLEDRITQLLGGEQVLPAVGQGALGIETRTDDAATRAAVTALDDPTSHRAVLAERSLLARLAGGCLAPIGALCVSPAAGSLHLRAVVLSVDGRRRLAASRDGTWDEAVALGAAVASDLLAQGADELIRAARA